MRVDQRNLTGTTGAETGRAQEAHSIGRDSRSGAASTRGGSAADQVELSPLSRALTASDSIRNGRVAELSAQYQAGQYQLDPAQISRSMIDDALGAPKL